MAKVGLIQHGLELAIQTATAKERLLPGMVNRSAERRGLALSPDEVNRLSAAILSSTGDVLNLDLDLPCGLGVSEAEVQVNVQAILDGISLSTEQAAESISQTISEVVPAVLKEVAKGISNKLSECSVQHTDVLSRLHANRVESVERLWGPALQRLEFLRHIVCEWGVNAQETRTGCFSQPSTAVALERLVARVYEVSGEIVVLAKQGYADGALARWRTLHEICVVAMFLARRTDRCATMYLLHHKVEELRILRADRASGTSSVLAIHRDRYARELRGQCASLVARFGAAYDGDYGWAAVELGRARVTFRDLEEHVGLETLRRGYQQANGAVHGGALATLTRISLGPLADHHPDMPPAYGCEVAASYTLASLTMLVAELCIDTESADLLAMNLVVQNCAMEVRTLIDRSLERISNSSPRARMLMRKELLMIQKRKLHPKFRH